MYLPASEAARHRPQSGALVAGAVGGSAHPADRGLSSLRVAYTLYPGAPSEDYQAAALGRPGGRPQRLGATTEGYPAVALGPARPPHGRHTYGHWHPDAQGSPPEVTRPSHLGPARPPHPARGYPAAAHAPLCTPAAASNSGDPGRRPSQKNSLRGGGG